TVRTGLQDFYQQYGSAFEATHKNITLRVVDESFENQDIYHLNLQDYKQYANESKLLSLDSRLRDEDFYVNEVPDFVADFLRRNDFNEIFGLTPTYTSYGIFYNKDIFDQYDIDYPQNYMTWDEL